VTGLTEKSLALMVLLACKASQLNSEVLLQILGDYELWVNTEAWMAFWFVENQYLNSILPLCRMNVNVYQVFPLYHARTSCMALRENVVNGINLTN
jgi:hypothetical protein